MEFVTASHNEEILNNNLLKSVAFLYDPPFIQRGFKNVSKAYNEAKTIGLTCYLHHDVYLPDSFLIDVLNGIRKIEAKNMDWGVIGVAGVRLKNGKRKLHGHISDRGNEWGFPHNLPHEVETLDELLLITKGDLRFDENLDLHFYGADICMQARQRGQKCYAINAFVHHNSNLVEGYRSDSFYACEKYFAHKWKKYLPIVTTCSLIS